MKPKIYNSELLLSTFIKKSNTSQLAQYIRSLNHYIDHLEALIDKYVDTDMDNDYEYVNDNELEDHHDADEN